MHLSSLLNPTFVCIVATTIWTAVGTLWGINELTLTRKIVVLGGAALLIALGIWSAIHQENESNAQAAKIDRLGERIGDIQKGIANLGSTAHLPADLSTDEILKRVGDLLPKNNSGVMTGADSTTGIAAGQGSQVIGSPVNTGSGTQINHIVNRVYINSAGHRTIPPKVVTKISAALKGASNTNATIYVIGTDAEVANYGTQIKDMLIAGGWNPSGLNTQINAAYNSALLGLYLGVKDLNHAPLAAQVLLDAFNKNGVPIEAAADANAADDQAINIIVGGKP